jgi:hypothetical protein
VPGSIESPVTPRTLGGLHGSRTASFEVLVSPPFLGLAAQAIGCRSLLSSTPSGIGAKVEALADRTSATVLLHGEYVVGPGPESSFPAWAHRADRQPTVGHCRSNLL